MIKLQNGYFIESDGTQFILKHNVIRKKKDTKEAYQVAQTVGYYGQLPQALNGYKTSVVLETIKEKDIDIKESIELINKLNEELKTITEEKA